MKLGLDPFAQINENEDEEEKSEEDECDGKDSSSMHSSQQVDNESDQEDEDMMLDGGLHLMNNKRSPSLKNQVSNSGQNSDCVTKVVDQCFDLN